jgi:Arc/MetJ-type ribon-helix-helix transcriptional regulator
MLYGRRCTHFVTKRVEFRVDEETAETLSELVARRKTTVSEVLREAVRRMDEQEQRERRRRIVDELAAMEIEEMPEPEELKRQLDSMHDVDLP